MRVFRGGGAMYAACHRPEGSCLRLPNSRRCRFRGRPIVRPAALFSAVARPCNYRATAVCICGYLCTYGSDTSMDNDLLEPDFQLVADMTDCQ